MLTIKLFLFLFMEVAIMIIVAAVLVGGVYQLVHQRLQALEPGRQSFQESRQR